MKILKFGGSSLATAERIQGVIQIIVHQYQMAPQMAVVFSAFGGVTDNLLYSAQQAALGDSSYQEVLSQLKQRHLAMAAELVAATQLERVQATVNQLFTELADILQGIFLIRELSARAHDNVLSFGERLSAFIISASIQVQIPETTFVDARELIKTDRNFSQARILYPETNTLIKNWFANNKKLAVIPGFIGSSLQNETTILGRGGSDFTAAIMGAALQVTDIEIWTDVDGIMTADPRKVPQAFPIPNITYKEALEMSHFGAKVIYPPTISPAQHADVPIQIKNTFNPKSLGTLITNHFHDQPSVLIRGISSIDNIALLRVEGSGMVGVCGVAKRLFGALAAKEINIILISQGSSEHSICFAVMPNAAQAARDAIETEFLLEMKAGLMEPIIVETELSVIAVVGENMRKTPGIAGKIFGALGRNGINVVTMVQGSSEYNISIVISKKDETKALNVIHEAFFLSSMTHIHIFLVGVGLIGRKLMSMIEKQRETLAKEYAIELHVVGLANSRFMNFAPQGYALDAWEAQLSQSQEKTQIDQYIRQMKQLNLRNSIFVDCTSNEEIALSYPEVLSANISIVTPNKKANSGQYSLYKTLKELSRRRGVKFLYETNVGAGLPIISSIIDLLSSGDKIIKIEAVLSGTLSYLFNTFMQGGNFSEVVADAQAKGFTEPDPRDDLNGMDVMRKLLILSRESGYALEISDIAAKPFLPEDCFAAPSVQAFYQKLEGYNALFAKMREQAIAENKALRFIASLDQGKATVALQAVSSDHPFYHLSGSDNIVALTTERYHVNPLVIKGQGAGAEVTAGEVLADIIRIAMH